MDYQINSGVWSMPAHGNNSFGRRIYMPSFCVILCDWPGPNYNDIAAAQPMPHPDRGINAYFADGHASMITLDKSDDDVDGKSPFFEWGLGL